MMDPPVRPAGLTAFTMQSPLDKMNESMASLDQQAAESIAFIRHTMARSASFTAVPGWGGMVMGLVGLGAAVFASAQSASGSWLAVWLGAVALAVPIGFGAMLLKARRHGLPLWSPAGRRFAQALLPALAAGAVLTMLVARTGRVELLPPLWLLLYGAGIMSGAANSVPVLTWIGGAVIAAGIGAAITVPRGGDLWLGVGFGVFHIVFGFIIARKHGG